MNSLEIQRKSKRSLKWSFFGELFAKISTPISTMVLARLLAPEIFGIATATTIVLTFCEAITDSGFAKYIIQHDFQDDRDFDRHLSVSLISSLVLALVLCAVVFLFRSPLSALVGNQGHEMVLAIACIQVPFASINAVLAASMKRGFHFKKLFIIKISYCAVPFAITIPLAFFGLSYWSLVIGTISAQVLQTPLLIILSKRKIRPCFSFSILKNMLSASLIMIVESVIIWGCSWASTALASGMFDQAAVGIMKVSNSTVDSIFSLFGTAFLAVLFPTLSRLKNDKKSFENSFLSIQSAAMAIMIPLGIGAFLYSSTITSIFLGPNWSQAAFVIGVLSLTRPLTYCFSNFMCEAFRSNGHFKSSIIYHLAYLALTITLMVTLGRISYELFVISSAIANVLASVFAVGILHFRYKIAVVRQISSLISPIIAATLMCFPALLALFNGGNASLAQSIGQILFCAGLYFVALGIIAPRQLKNSFSYFTPRRKRPSADVISPSEKEDQERFP